MKNEWEKIKKFQLKSVIRVGNNLASIVVAFRQNNKWHKIWQRMSVYVRMQWSKDVLRSCYYGRTGNAKGFQVKSKKIKIPSLVKSNCEIMKAKDGQTWYTCSTGGEFWERKLYWLSSHVAFVNLLTTMIPWNFVRVANPLFGVPKKPKKK